MIHEVAHQRQFGGAREFDNLRLLIFRDPFDTSNGSIHSL